jgi:hypothetical protein
VPEVYVRVVLVVGFSVTERAPRSNVTLSGGPLVQALC